MNEENTTLLPLEERQVDFYGDVLVAALVDEQKQTQIYVPVRPLCDYLGIDWASQYKRIQRDPVLSEVSRSVVVTTTEAGRRDTICLPLEYLNGWLFGLNANRVKRELRQKIVQYQKDCYWVLAQAFQADALTAHETKLPAETQPGAATASLLQIREMGLAIVQMAEQQ